MLGINGKQWNDIQWTDVEEFLNEIEESFFFEFKKDEVSGAKLIKEIAALANTYGGYVFLGVSDDKKIEGCQKWDEQRIHATIHDSLSPIPSFDVKKFETNDNKKIYIIKVDEGPEPPYITNKGEIYERISSGSFVIKESLRLSQMYTKKEDSWKKLEKKITIDSVQEKVENVLGYIDVGFEPTFTNLEDVKNCFFEISDNDLKQIFTDEIQDGNIIVEILNNGKKRDWQSIVNPSCEECPYGVFEQNNRERNDWQNTLNEILELYGIDEENMPLF